MGSYVYNAWGKVVSVIAESGYSDVVNRNHLRYRGYYYDTESNLYYLQSRYYDPANGRFVNADSLLGGEAGMNRYAYCGGNPVMFVDPCGKWMSSGGAYIGGGSVQADPKEPELITNQNDISNKFLGGYNFSDKGCGVVAIYNILILKGYCPSLNSIINYVERNGYAVLNGLLGVAPWNIGNVLEACGISYSNFPNYSGFIEYNETSKEGDLYIITYWNGKYLVDNAHTVAVQYNGSQFVVYNRHGTTKYYDNLTDMIGFSEFWYGIKIY